MELLLIRHGLPERIVSDGPVDPSLAPDGRRQAELLATWLRGEAPDALVSSPMARAHETARPIAAAFHLTHAVIDGLAELDRGAPAYIPLEEIRGTDHPHWKQLLEDWVGPAGAERRAAFQATVVASVEQIVSERPGDRVAVVCHGGVINAYLAHVLALDRMLFFDPGYTSISRVLAASDGRRQVLSMNEMAHLRALTSDPA